MVGQTLVGHRIESVLGRGGMGVVYRARHEQLGRVRALKVLPAELAEDVAFRERFEREWRVAASIEHPGIVEVLDAGETGGQLYILMRLVEGPDLAQLIQLEGPLSPARTLHLLEQIADALDAAHSQGLVHRDVTPRNILVSAGDHAFLADFGVARMTATRGLTRTGYFVGNLDYAAPEQIEGKAIDGRADIYALGGVLFTALTGRCPYVRDADVQLMYAHLQDPPPAPSAFKPDLPRALDEVVATAMAKSPGDRFQNARALVEALRKALPPDVLDTGQLAPAGNGAPGKVTLPDAGALEGVELGNYKVTQQIGRGGMGVVYLADRPHLSGKVALKVLSSELATDERFKNRFVRESQMASALEHPNIIPVYDAGEAGGRFFIAMRYVDGPSLKQLIELEGRLEPGRALNILAQAGSALDAAHEHELLHRDVKPANILITKAGASEFGEHVYLTDFGVSKRLGSHSGLTATGQFIGTLSYAAPEQIEGKPVDHRIDIYALACVLYEMLTGVPPFVRDNDVALLWAHVHDQPPILSSARPDLPAALDDVVFRAMSKSPDERPATCAELVTAVRQAVLPGLETLRPARAASPAETVLDSGVAPLPEAEATAGPAPTVAEPVPAEPTAAEADAVGTIAAISTSSVAPPPETVTPPVSETAAPVAETETPAVSTTEELPEARTAAASTVAPPIAPDEVIRRTSPAETAVPVVPEEDERGEGGRRRKLLLVGLVIVLLGGGAVAAAIALSGSSSRNTGSTGNTGSLGISRTGRTGSTGPTHGKLVISLTAAGHDRMPVAGRTFEARTTILKNGKPFTYARPECPGTLGGQSFAGRPYAHLHGQVGCLWELPSGSAGKSLSGSVKVKNHSAAAFSHTVEPAPTLAIAKPSTVSQPQLGIYSVSFAVRINDPGHVLNKAPAEKASCLAQVAGQLPEPANHTLSADGSTLLCSWYVPASAAGKSLRLQGTVSAPGLGRSTTGVSRTVAVPQLQPQPNPQPPGPTPPPTPPPPTPPPPGPPPTVPD